MATATENLINGEKPQFGNPEHIKFVKASSIEEVETNLNVLDLFGFNPDFLE